MTTEKSTSAFQLDDREAFTELYHRYWDLLYKHVLSRVADNAIAQDIVQDVFVSLWQKRQRLRVTTTIEAFLLGCAKMQVLSYFKTEKLRQQVIEKAMQQLDVFVDDTDVVQLEVMEASLGRAVGDMPENMRQSFLLRCDNRSIREIADLLGIAEQTVSNNLNEAVKRLRKKMAQQPPSQYLTCLSTFLVLCNN